MCKSDLRNPSMLIDVNDIYIDSDGYPVIDGTKVELKRPLPFYYKGKQLMTSNRPITCLLKDRTLYLNHDFADFIHA